MIVKFKEYLPPVGALLCLAAALVGFSMLIESSREQSHKDAQEYDKRKAKCKSAEGVYFCAYRGDCVCFSPAAVIK